jgi:anti-anti-sigma factor
VEFSLTRDESQRDPDELVEVKIVKGGDPVVVRVTGKILCDTLGPLAHALSRLDPASAPRLVLDLSEVSMCDSSGLNLLVRIRSERTAAGGWLRLAGTRPLVDNVLRVTNLTRILPRYATVEEAVADA